jgi:transposase
VTPWRSPAGGRCPSRRWRPTSNISTSTLHRWIRQADTDDGIKDGLTSAEQAEIVELRRKTRRLEMENEILRRAAAYFAQHQLPK